jgi:hypothetical protein
MMRSRMNIGFLLLAAGVLTFFVSASGVLPGAVVHASTLGPNLDISGTGSFTGSAGCPFTPTLTLDTSATNPGFKVSSNPVLTCTLAGTLSGTETLTFTGLNGYEIDDFAASLTCGVTGSDTAGVTFSSLGTLTCQSESNVGDTTTVSEGITFSPVSSKTQTLTLLGSSGSGASSISFDSFSFHISLVPPSAVPEPSSLLLLCTGLVGLAGMTRRGLLRR